jgi:asparagine synthetase B (glutamine-hydrolysing)
MCGITGIIKTSSQSNCIDPVKFQTICHIQYHRGPDDYGFAYFDNHYLLVAGKNIEHPQNGRFALVIEGFRSSI